MLNNKFSDFVAYFRQVALEHLVLNDFIHGTTADIMGKGRSDLKYPLLWLETPSLKIKTNEAGHTEGTRSFAFIILWNVHKDEATPEQIDQVWELTEAIALDVLTRMKQDNKKRLFKFDPGEVSLDPISTLFIDNDYGWRVELNLEKYLNLCYDPTKWAASGAAVT